MVFNTDPPYDWERLRQWLLDFKNAYTQSVLGQIPDGSITTAKLANNSVTSSKIVDGTIQTIDLADGSVTEPKLATFSVTQNKIADNAVTNTKLFPNSVTTDKILDGTIQTNDLANNIINTIKIIDDAITLDKINGLTNGVDGYIGQSDTNALFTIRCNYTATTNPQTTDNVGDGYREGSMWINMTDNSIWLCVDALFGTWIDITDSGSFTLPTHNHDGSAGSGGLLANNIINTNNLVDDSVTNAKLSINSVGTNELINDSVTNAKLAINSVGATEIINDSVTNDKLAPNSVGATELIDDSVTNAKLAPNSVTAIEIAANSVGNSELIDGSVQTSKLAADAVTNAKLADDSVRAENLVGTVPTVQGYIRQESDGTFSTLTSIDGGALTNNSITASKLNNLDETTNGFVHHNGTSFVTIKSNLSALVDPTISDNATLGYAKGSLWVNTVDGSVFVCVDSTIGTWVDVSASGGLIDHDHVLTGGTLGADSIGTTQIQDASVTNAKLGLDSVNGTNISDNSIDSEHIVAGSIDNIHLASEIDGGKISSDTITSTQIASNAITNSELADDSITVPKMSGLATSNVGFVKQSLDNNFTTKGLVDNSDIADDSISGSKLVNDSVTSSKIATDSILATHLNNLSTATSGFVYQNTDETLSTKTSIENSDISPDAIDGTKIADNSINTEHITDNSIDSQHYVDGSIDNVHLAAGIDGIKVLDNSIDASKLNDLNTTLTAYVAHNGASFFSLKHNFVATTPPAATNDLTENYVVGSVWIDTINKNIYMCEDNTASSANWIHLNSISGYTLEDHTHDGTAGSGGLLTGSALDDNTIDSRHYVVGSIDNEHLASLSVATTNLQDSSVTNAKIAANAVTDDKISGFISGAKISPDSLTASQIANNAIGNQELADGAIQVAKINNLTSAKQGFVRQEIDDTFVTDIITFETTDPTNLNDDTFGHLVGSLWFNTLTTKLYVCMDNTTSNAVWKQYVGDEHITTSDIAADAVDGSKIANNSIDSEHIVSGAVDDVHLASGINGSKISAGTISLYQMGVYSIDSDQYVYGSIDNIHLANGIDGAKLIAGTVGTTELEDDSVTNAKIGADEIDGYHLNGLNVGVPGVEFEVLQNGSNFNSRKLKTDTTAPTVNDDINSTYSVGSMWIDTTNKKMYRLIDNTSGAAIWQQFTGSDHVSTSDIQDNAITMSKINSSASSSTSLFYDGSNIRTQYYFIRTNSGGFTTSGTNVSVIDTSDDLVSIANTSSLRLRVQTSCLVRGTSVGDSFFNFQWQYNNSTGWSVYQSQTLYTENILESLPMTLTCTFLGSLMTGWGNASNQYYVRLVVYRTLGSGNLQLISESGTVKQTTFEELRQ